MGEGEQLQTPNLPIAIFRLFDGTERYLLYDVNVVSWLRREHHILGVFSGSLPQVPQQNVFLGLPLRLMSEEARLLVDEDIAYVVDDTECHYAFGRSPNAESLRQYMEDLEAQGRDAASAASQLKAAKSAQARLRMSGSNRGKNADAVNGGEVDFPAYGRDGQPSGEPQSDRAQLLVPQPQAGWAVTPPTASVLIPALPTLRATQPQVNGASYALFRLIHSQGYYLSPGLRFGCQFMAYPGDPLRYHSHFLSVSAEWEEEIDLLHLLGGGRLGTGVKKGFLVGGPSSKRKTQHKEARAFCIEWAGM